MEGIGFTVVMYFQSQSRHELSVERERLENEIEEMVQSQQDLKTVVKELNRQNKKIRKQYMEAVREYENHEKINDIDIALNTFFDG